MNGTHVGVNVEERFHDWTKAQRLTWLESDRRISPRLVGSKHLEGTTFVRWSIGIVDDRSPVSLVERERERQTDVIITVAAALLRAE